MLTDLPMCQKQEEAGEARRGLKMLLFCFVAKPGSQKPVLLSGGDKRGESYMYFKSHAECLLGSPVQI